MWLWLGLAIVSEIAATLMLRQSGGFTNPGPSAAAVLGYAVAFYALSQSLVRGMFVSTAYAIWSGVGIAALALIGALFLDERPGLVQVAGLVLVTAGIVTLQLSSSG